MPVSKPKRCKNPTLWARDNELKSDGTRIHDPGMNPETAHEKPKKASDRNLTNAFD